MHPPILTVCVCMRACRLARNTALVPKLAFSYRSACTRGMADSRERRVAYICEFPRLWQCSPALYLWTPMASTLQGPSASEILQLGNMDALRVQEQAARVHELLKTAWNLLDVYIYFSENRYCKFLRFWKDDIILKRLRTDNCQKNIGASRFCQILRMPLW